MDGKLLTGKKAGSFLLNNIVPIMFIVIGIVGMIGMGVNYSAYKRILEKSKKKYAFEIMELAKEISGK